MKAKQIIEKIQDNWPAKIVCLVIAIFLYVFYQVATLDRKSFTVPLTVSAEAGIVPVGSYPRSVKVTVRGKPEDLATVKVSGITAYLDLNTCSKDGKVQLPVLVKLSSDLMLIDPFEVHVNPQSVTLDVEESVTEFSPVSALVEDAPAHGFQVGKITVQPEEVLISGPRSLAQNCTRLQTSPVSVKDASSQIIATVDVENTGSLLSLAGEKQVTVAIEIIPIKTTKKFESLPVRLINISPILEIEGDTSAIDLIIYGNELDLESYTPGSFVVTGDCADVEKPGSYEIPLSYNLPETLSIGEEAVHKIKVIFKEKRANKEEKPKTETPAEKKEDSSVPKFDPNSESGESS